MNRVVLEAFISEWPTFLLLDVGFRWTDDRLLPGMTTKEESSTSSDLVSIKYPLKHIKNRLIFFWLKNAHFFHLLFESFLYIFERCYEVAVWRQTSRMRFSQPCPTPSPPHPPLSLILTRFFIVFEIGFFALSSPHLKWSPSQKVSLYFSKYFIYFNGVSFVFVSTL